jgi:hypothetical protein
MEERMNKKIRAKVKSKKEIEAELKMVNTLTSTAIIKLEKELKLKADFCEELIINLSSSENECSELKAECSELKTDLLQVRKAKVIAEEKLERLECSYKHTKEELDSESDKHLQLENGIVNMVRLMGAGND